MKHVTARVFIAPNFTKGLIRITAQTNISAAFGNSEDGKTFTAKNGITLGSNRRPSRDADKDSAEGLNTIWLRGTDSSKNDDCIAIPVKRLRKVIVAIEEYNAHYTTEAINARVQAKRAAAEAAERARLAREAQAREAIARAYRLHQQIVSGPCTEIVG